MSPGEPQAHGVVPAHDLAGNASVRGEPRFQPPQLFARAEAILAVIRPPFLGTLVSLAAVADVSVCVGGGGGTKTLAQRMRALTGPDPASTVPGPEC